MLSRTQASGVNNYLKATSTAVRVSQIGVPVKTVYGEEQKGFSPAHNYQYASSYSAKNVQSNLLARSVAVNGAQVRLAHTDIKVPNFNDYRKKETLNPHKKSSDTIDERRGYAYLATATFGVGSAVLAKNAIRNIVGILSPAKDVLAMSKVEVNLDEIPEGKNVTVKWRGKPVFIKHRTPEEIKREQSVNLSELRDPQSDSDRVQKPEWLVLLGVCTHLGCVPVPGQGEYHGYFCPCHGSHYDASGRIRKGPAPLNLEVPEYSFNDNILVVG